VAVDPRRLSWSSGRRLVLAAGAVSVVFYAADGLVAPPGRLEWSPTMLRAGRLMEESLRVLRQHCEKSGLLGDPSEDPNRTCLIGPELGPLMTSLGHLEAKRTATSPEMGGLLVHLLEEAGVARGDRVGVGCSGSFPGFLVATMAATRAMEVDPVVVLSLGASSFGATGDGFHLLDLYELLWGARIFAARPAAVSLGGDRDVGLDLDPSLRYRLLERISSSGLLPLVEADLGANVARRMAIYSGRGAPPVTAYINIGGGEASIGTAPFVLGLEAGIVRPDRLPPRDGRGVLAEMLAEGVPVIHLLHVRGLSRRYGVTWDPIPLPQPGRSSLRDPDAGPDAVHTLMAAGYLFTLVLLGLAALLTPRWS